MCWYINEVFLVRHYTWYHAHSMLLPGGALFSREGVLFFKMFSIIYHFHYLKGSQTVHIFFWGGVHGFLWFLRNIVHFQSTVGQSPGWHQSGSINTTIIIVMNFCKDKLNDILEINSENIKHLSLYFMLWNDINIAAIGGHCCLYKSSLPNTENGYLPIFQSGFCLHYLDAISSNPNIHVFCTGS